MTFSQALNTMREQGGGKAYRPGRPNFLMVGSYGAVHEIGPELGGSIAPFVAMPGDHTATDWVVRK